MALTLLFFVLWLLVTVGLRALAVRVAPGLAGRRATLLVAGLLALAITWPLVQRLTGSVASRDALAWPRDANVPLPRAVAPELLARLPFTTVSGDALAARALFVEASRRRPVALMALRLAEEGTRPVQRYLVLHGDTLALIVDERRRSDGRGELYELPLADVVLGTCAARDRDCRPTDPAAAPVAGAGYRILGRFPGDSLYAVRY